MSVWRFASRYCQAHRVQTLVTAACLALAAWLPIGVPLLMNDFERQLTARARTTPVVVGGKGSRVDLVLHGLYFRTSVTETLPYSTVTDLSERKNVQVLPLMIQFTARERPIVGCTPGYFSHRSLTPATGTLPKRLGDCFLGSRIAAEFDLKPGDRLLSDPENVFDIAGQRPLKMRVTGVAQPTGSADDDAVFVELDTTWLLAGIGHGHDPADANLPTGVLPTHLEVTDENINTFHFHGRRRNFPLTAVVVIPKDAKAESLLLGSFVDHDSLQALKSETVIDELLTFAFRIRQFLDLASGIILVVAACLLALVAWLTRQLRSDERRTLVRLGASNGLLFRKLLAELTIVFAIATAFTTALVTTTFYLGSNILQSWLT